MKKFFVVLLCLLLLAGCGKKEEPKPDTPSQNGGGNSAPADKKEETEEPDKSTKFEVTVHEDTIKKEADDGKGETERVDLKQVRVEFSRLPKNAEELSSVDRSGDNGRFLTMALLIAAYKAWTPENETACEEMMKALMNSPSMPDTYTNYTKSFVKERMMQNEKWDYIADAYFDGSTPENGYVPDEPLSITLREYPYLPQTSTISGTELLVDKIVTDFKGADTERMISVYEDPKDGLWYIFSDSYGPLLADVKTPERYK